MRSADLSIVGMETKPITINEPDVFVYYCLLSGGFYLPVDSNDQSKVTLIFVSCGSRGRNDAVKSAATTLNDAGKRRFLLFLKIQRMSFLPEDAVCINWHHCCFKNIIR
jgi:hypothetical protein